MAHTTTTSESVWFRTKPVGNDRMVATSGGVAAPLLAGFCLAAIAQLVSADQPPNTARYGIAFFAVAGVCLLNALQLASIALGYWASPAQRLEYYPEVRTDDATLNRVRDHQWQETRVRGRYVRIAGHLYNTGLVAFLVGLGFIVVPNCPWPWPWISIVTVAVVALATVLELVWAISGATRPRWLLPDPDDKPAPQMSTERVRTTLFGETAVKGSSVLPSGPDGDAVWAGLGRQLDQLRELRSSGRLSALDAAVGRYRALRRAQQVDLAAYGSNVSDTIAGISTSGAMSVDSSNSDSNEPVRKHPGRVDDEG